MLETVVSTSFDVPANVNVWPDSKASFDPLSAASVNDVVISAISLAILADVEVNEPEILAVNALVAISVANEELKLEVIVFTSARVGKSAISLAILALVDVNAPLMWASVTSKVTVLSATAVVIGPAPANVNVSVELTALVVPESAAISNDVLISAISLAIDALVEVNDPLMSVANCAEPLTSVGLFIIFANGTEPDTIWPPCATITLPVVLDPKWTSIALTLDNLTVDGIICSLLPSSYTLTITFLEPKLWVTDAVVALVNVDSTVAVCDTDISVKLLPSPLNEPV